MSRQTWSELVSWATTNGTTIANTTTESLIYPNVTIPANLLQDGRALRLTVAGNYGLSATTAVIFKLRWGGVAGTILATTGSVFAGGTSVGSAPWTLEALIQTRSNGSAGTLMVLGNAVLHTGANVSTATATGAPAVAPFAGPTSAGSLTPITVDLTADTALAVTAVFGTASAANTLTGLQYLVEVLN